MILGAKYRIGVQRKQFPADFTASLDDGRLYGQLPALSTLDKAVLIIEGYGNWTEDGELIGNKYQRLTKQAFHGLLFSIMFEFGVPSIIVANMDETALVLQHLESWAEKTKHTSLKSRPGASKTSWGTTTEQHLASHIVQGFPGVGQELAGRIVDKFEGVPLTWTVDMGELMEVEGIGKVKAKKMWDALDAVSGK